MEQKAVRVKNLDSGEVYSSLTEAGYRLGYLSTLKVPPHAWEDDAEFTRRGVRLKIIPNQ